MGSASANDWIRLARRPETGPGVFFLVPHTSRCFDGHFAGAPILPGVTHLALALATCEPEGLHYLEGVRDVRFSAPILPGDELEVRIESASDPSARRFEIRCGGRVASSGVLLLAQGDVHGDV